MLGMANVKVSVLPSVEVSIRIPVPVIDILLEVMVCVEVELVDADVGFVTNEVVA